MSAQQDLWEYDLWPEVVWYGLVSRFMAKTPDFSPDKNVNKYYHSTRSHFIYICSLTAVYKKVLIHSATPLESFQGF